MYSYDRSCISAISDQAMYRVFRLLGCSAIALGWDTVSWGVVSLGQRNSYEWGFLRWAPGAADVAYMNAILYNSWTYGVDQFSAKVLVKQALKL